MGFISWIAKKFSSDGPVAFTILISVKDGKGLLLRRGATAPYAPGLWNFPGGHVDKGETAIEAAKRECEEEAGITPQNLKPLGKNGYVSYFRGETNNTKVKLGTNWGIMENDAYAWVAFDEISKYQMSEHDMVYHWYLAFGKEPPKPKKIPLTNDSQIVKVMAGRYLQCAEILRKNAATNPKLLNYAANIESKIPTLARAIDKNKHDLVFWEKLGTINIPELQQVVKTIISFWRRQLMQDNQGPSFSPNQGFVYNPVDTTTTTNQYKTFMDYMRDKNKGN